MKVLNYGSLNIDYVYSVDHILKEGETISSSGMEIFCGGKGLNQSIALAKAGIPVFHAGMVGGDGDSLLNACKEGGVDTTFIKKLQGKSGHTVIQVDKNGQNSILLYGGSNQCQTKEHIDFVLSHFAAGDLLLLQNEVNLIDYIIDRAYERGIEIVLNPSPYDEKLNACDLSKISVLLLNEVEGEQITGEKNPQLILEMLIKRYPKLRTVLTLGGAGAVYQDDFDMFHQEIFKVKVVDTTAAGDTFTGYFIAGITENMSVQDALKIASKAASIAVSRAGATASIPGKEEVFSSINL